MIQLAARVPVQLTPQQTALVAVVLVGALVAVVVVVLFESVVGGLVTVVLRLTGHRPPKKSSFSAVLDDLDERMRRNESRDK